MSQFLLRNIEGWTMLEKEDDRGFLLTFLGNDIKID